MVEKTLNAAALARIEHYLSYAENGYGRLEELHRDWDRESADDKADLADEWSLVHSAVLRVQELVAEYGLPPRLRPRYAALIERVARDEPLVAALWTRP